MTEDYWEPVSVQPPHDAGEEPEPAPVSRKQRRSRPAGSCPERKQKNTGEIPVLQKAEEKKQIVTAAGKVIETDAEEIIRQKAEKEAGGGGSKGGRREAGCRCRCAPGDPEKRGKPRKPMWPRRWSF